MVSTKVPTQVFLTCCAGASLTSAGSLHLALELFRDCPAAFRGAPIQDFFQGSVLVTTSWCSYGMFSQTLRPLLNGSSKRSAAAGS